jgi:hypothetical protein
MYVCYRTYFWGFVALVPPRLLVSIFTMLRPLLLQRVIVFVGEYNQSEDRRNGLIGALVFLVLGSAVSGNHTHSKERIILIPIYRYSTLL